MAPPSLSSAGIHPLTVEKEGDGAILDPSLDNHKGRRNTGAIIINKEGVNRNMKPTEASVRGVRAVN